MFELRQLQNFLIVAEQGNISKAAALIRIAQPALSRQLQALEAELGVQLFDRTALGVAPTQQGLLLAEHAQALLARAVHAREEVTAIAGLPSGEVSIGVVSSLGVVVLPELALRVGQRYPKIRLRLVESYSGRLLHQTINGQLDAAVLYAERQLTRLVTRPLLSEPIVVIGSSGRFEPMAKIDLPSLCAEALILPTLSSRLRLCFEEAVGRAGINPDAGLEVDSVPALVQLVEAGAGLSILPFSAARSGIVSGRLSFAMIEPYPLMRSLILARLPDRRPSPALEIVEQTLNELLGDMRDCYRWTLPQERAAIFSYQPSRPIR